MLQTKTPLSKGHFIFKGRQKENHALRRSTSGDTARSPPKKLAPTYDKVLRAICNGKFKKPPYFRTKVKGLLTLFNDWQDTTFYSVQYSTSSPTCFTRLFSPLFHKTFMSLLIAKSYRRDLLASKHITYTTLTLRTMDTT